MRSIEKIAILGTTVAVVLMFGLTLVLVRWLQGVPEV